MNRRGFFSLMAGAAGAALVPWRGNMEPLIVLPPKLVVPRNQLLTIDMITKEALEVLHRNLQFRTVRQYTINNDELPMRVEAQYVNVRRPPRYVSHAFAYAEFPLDFS